MTYTHVKNLIPRLAIMYHVKIGMKGDKRESRAGGTYFLPKKLDHFIVTSRERGKDGNFIEVERFKELLKNNAREIDIRLLYDDIFLNFPHRYACYVTANDLKKVGIESRAKRCYCTGNGEEATRLTKDGKKVIDCNPEHCEIYQGKKNSLSCKLFARLIFTLPGIESIGACADFTTTSGETIGNIFGSLTLIQNKTQGILAGIPLKLKTYAATDETPSGTTTNWKVMVEFTGKDQSLIDEARQIAVQRSKSMVDIKQIQASAERMIKAIEQDEEVDIGDEFFPPSKIEPDYSDIPSEVLSQINKFTAELGYNDAKVNMLLGEYKGRETELVKKLEDDMGTQKTVEVKVEEKPAQETPETTKKPAKESPLKSDKVTPKKDLFDGTKPMQTDAKPEIKNGIGKERDELIEKIKKLMSELPEKDFNETRKKYPVKIDSFSIQELKGFMYEMEGIALGATSGKK